jgi:hypothetical protein
MESLRILLVKNHSLLTKLQARSLYCCQVIAEVENDTHLQFGPFSGYWDEWMMEAEEMNSELLINNENTTLFLAELRDFVNMLDSKKRLSKSDKSYIVEVTSLADDKKREQEELLESINERIKLHRDLTKQLRLVEAIDGLED